MDGDRDFGVSVVQELSEGGRRTRTMVYVNLGSVEADGGGIDVYDRRVRGMKASAEIVADRVRAMLGLEDGDDGLAF